MAKPRMDLSAFVGKLLEEQDGDVLREGIRVLSQALMETEVAGLIGAAYAEGPAPAAAQGQEQKAQNMEKKASKEKKKTKEAKKAKKQEHKKGTGATPATPATPAEPAK